MPNELTAERLRELLHYDPETGVFTWRAGANKGKGGGKRQPGAVAGCAPTGKRRYRVIHVGGVLHYAHRLAWLYMTGAWPETTVDHEDRDRENNRWKNLREATMAQQRQNMSLSKKNTSGYQGVTWDGEKMKWAAQIMVDGKHHHLGRFDDIEQAHAARKQGKARLHPFQPK